MILIWGILAPALSIAMLVFSVQEHGNAARTSYTQAHGARRAARVISEDTGTGKDPTSTVRVRLSGPPVYGRDTATVHIQGVPAYSPGTPLTVLVDPRDPGYAELPGAPYTSSFQWEAPLVIGLAVILVFPFGLGVVYLRQLRSRRRLLRSLLR